jgi:hypothetical protein
MAPEQISRLGEGAFYGPENEHGRSSKRTDDENQFGARAIAAVEKTNGRNSQKTAHP